MIEATKAQRRPRAELPEAASTGRKTCKQCSVEKTLDQFYHQVFEKRGSVQIDAVCKACRSRMSLLDRATAKGLSIDDYLAQRWQRSATARVPKLRKRRRTKAEILKVLETGAQTCMKCNIEKRLDQFFRKSDSLTGFATVCKECRGSLHDPRKYLQRQAALKGISIDDYLDQRGKRSDHRVPRLRRRRRTASSQCPVVTATGLRQCLRCGEVKPYDAFAKDCRRSAGISSTCSACKYANKAAWKRANRSKSVAQDQRRRARIRDLPSTLTDAEWSIIKQIYGNKCAYCHRKRPLTMDHVVPISKGGPHTADNVVPACRSCNSRKGARQPHAPLQMHLLM